MEINFSILGSGRIIKYFNCESELNKLIGHMPNEEIRNMLYSDLFNTLGLLKPNGQFASTFFEVLPDKQIVAYEFDKLTRLEIKAKGMTRVKIWFNEVTSDRFLFPLYNYNIIKIEDLFDDGILVIESDLGSFGKCKLNIDKFDIGSLLFEIAETNSSKNLLITHLKYKGMDLDFRKGDSLFSGKVEILKLSNRVS